MPKGLISTRWSWKEVTNWRGFDRITTIDRIDTAIKYGAHPAFSCVSQTFASAHAIQYAALCAHIYTYIFSQQHVIKSDALFFYPTRTLWKTQSQRFFFFFFLFLSIYAFPFVALHLFLLSLSLSLSISRSLTLSLSFSRSTFSAFFLFFRKNFYSPFFSFSFFCLLLFIYFVHVIHVAHYYVCFFFFFVSSFIAYIAFFFFFFAFFFFFFFWGRIDIRMIMIDDKWN